MDGELKHQPPNVSPTDTLEQNICSLEAVSDLRGHNHKPDRALNVLSYQPLIIHENTHKGCYRLDTFTKLLKSRILFLLQNCLVDRTQTWRACRTPQGPYWLALL